MTKRKRSRVGLILIALFVAADVSGTVGHYWVVREGVRSDRLPTHRIAVILFSGFDADGKLDGETLRRIHHAVESVAQEDSCLILCCGGARPQSGRSGSLLMRDYLLERGYNPSSVVAETTSNSTRSNIRTAAAILGSSNVGEATLISSPIHLPRVRHTATRESGGIAFDFTAYPLEHGKPPVNPATVYCQIHHEWVAWVAEAILPDAVYHNLLNRFRS